MIYNIYAAYDKKAQVYSEPILLKNDEVAKRTFGNVVNSKDHMYATNTEDFSIAVIGTYNNENAELIPGLRAICDMTELKQEIAPNE